MVSRSSRRGRWPGWVLVAPLMIVGVASARWIGSSLPACLFHQQTGLYCPGCGATRAAVSMGELQIRQAFGQNGLFVFAVLAGGLFVILSGCREKFPNIWWLPVFKWRLSFLWIVFVALVSFTVLRNMSGFEWLTPMSFP